MSSPAASTRPDGTIPVLSLHQPHATLVELLVKWLETRSWSTTYRGRLAIASTKTLPPEYGPSVVQGEGWSQPIGDWRILHKYRAKRGAQDRIDRFALVQRGERELHPMPLGCILATVELVDVVPMVAHAASTANDQPHLMVGTRYDPERLLLCRPSEGWHSSNDGTGGVSNHFEWDVTTVTDQAPYGLFAPGRYAWVFNDVRRLTTPVPFSGGRMLTKFWTPTEEAA